MNRIKRFLAGALALLMIFPLTVLAAPPKAEGEYVRYKILDAANMLALLTGSAVSEAEKEFLEKYYDGEISYNAAIPGGLITVENGVATAGPYQTKTAAGKTIAWTAEGEILLQNGMATAEYRGALTIPKNEANRLLSFVYDEAVNAAKAESQIAEYERQKKLREEYLQKKTQFDADKKAHEEYSEAKKKYDADYAAFLVNRGEWEDYWDYLNQKNIYETETLRDYNEKKAEYDQKKTEYDQEKKAYNTAMEQYLKNHQKIVIALNPLESMFVEYGNWDGTKYNLGVRKVGSLYAALQNDELVNMLMEYQDELCSKTSLTEKEFQSLKKTSDELNQLLEQYAAKRAISQKEALAFYQANYASIRDKFNLLYENMMRILNPTIFNIMCLAVDERYPIEKEYKKWRIRNVLCQIYAVRSCLDDGISMTGKWAFYNNEGDDVEYQYATFLNQEQIRHLTDSNQSNPAGLVWEEEPAPFTRDEPIEPTKPNPPVEVTRPTQEIDEPEEPEFVAEPEEPVFVEEPTKPTTDRYEAVGRCEKILAAYHAGTLQKRTSFSASPTVFLKETVYRRYDVETGSSANAETIYRKDGTPVDSEDDVETEWQGDGKTYELIGFKQDGTCYYPIYEVEDSVFEIVFTSEGKEILRQKYSYGQMPSPDMVPVKAATDTHVYEFLKWSPALSPVKGAQTYDAVFEQRVRQYTVTFRFPSKKDGGIEQGELIGTYRWQDMPSVPKPLSDYIEGSYRYTFVGWDTPVSQVRGDAVYTAEYEKTALTGGEDANLENPTVKEQTSGYFVEFHKNTIACENLIQLAATDGKKTMSFSFTSEGVLLDVDVAAVKSFFANGVASVQLLTESDTDGKGFGIVFFDADGKRVYPDGYMRLTVPAENSGEGRLCLKRYFADGSSSLLETVKESGGVFKIEIDPTSTYGAVTLYTVTVDNGGKKTSVEAEAGEWIPLSIAIPDSHRLEGLLLVKDGETEGILLDTADGFIMPEYNGALTVRFSEILYTVEFRYRGGSVTQTYRFGETIQAPEIPLSVTTDGYVYSFIGWDTIFLYANEDMVIEAKYEMTAEEEIADNGNATQGFVRHNLFTFFIIGAVAVGGILLIAGVILGIRSSRGRDSKRKERRSNDE